MKVRIPSPLYPYAGGRNEVEVNGSTLAELLEDLDRRFPGIRFRMIDEQDAIRPHMRIFVNEKPVDDLSTRIRPDDGIQIIQALSGG
jgi:molybdopterin converting factor small subunit